jgi:flagellar basal-body rod protein FlgG
MPNILNIAESGMRRSLQQLDAISNNMANINTQGYKREVYLNRGFQSFMPAGTATMQQPGEASRITHDYSPAPLKFTGSSLDVAIEGDGYFQLQTPQGVLLTRNGQFQIDQQGQLVSAQGWPVVMRGNMTFDRTNFKISGDGTIVLSGQNQAQLDIVTTDPKLLDMVGPGLFKPSEATSPTTKPSYIRQGYLETSNVNSLNEMVNLMTVTRHIESSQQLIRAYDEVIDNAISTLGQY